MHKKNIGKYNMLFLEMHLFSFWMDNFAFLSNGSRLAILNIRSLEVCNIGKVLVEFSEIIQLNKGRIGNGNIALLQWGWIGPRNSGRRIEPIVNQTWIGLSNFLKSHSPIVKLESGWIMVKLEWRWNVWSRLQLAQSTLFEIPANDNHRMLNITIKLF